MYMELTTTRLTCPCCSGCYYLVVLLAFLEKSGSQESLGNSAVGKRKRIGVKNAENSKGKRPSFAAVY